MHPDFRPRRLGLSQGPLHVWELGPSEGPALVFLHGVLANARLWEAVALRLGIAHRCVLLELPLGAHPEAMDPGADLSPAGVVALVVEALDALGLPQAVLVGNDSGGALCQLLIAAYPERLSAVVLTSADAYQVWLPWVFKPFELAAFVPGAIWAVGQLLRFSWVRGLPFALGWLARRLPVELSLAFGTQLARHGWARRDLAKFLRGISPKLTLAAAVHFPRFDRPVLLAWSRDDRFFSLALAERLQAELPNAQLEVIDDAYTFSPIDQPEAVAAHIEALLARLPGSGPVASERDGRGDAEAQGHA